MLEGKVVAGGLTDIAKFYDNVSLNFLARAAKELGYPHKMLCLALKRPLEEDDSRSASSCPAATLNRAMAA